MSRRISTLVVVSLLVAAACGQKEGVHVATAGGSSGGESAGPATTRPSRTSVATVPKGPGDTDGVTDTEIRIGVHAPLTGAGANAPSFEQGKDLYFQSVGQINGRTVKVFFEDDKYNPSSAVEACKKMVEQDKVFLLVGRRRRRPDRGVRQVRRTAGVPYLAEGVGEAGLDELSPYFALVDDLQPAGPAARAVHQERRQEHQGGDGAGRHGQLRGRPHRLPRRRQDGEARPRPGHHHPEGRGAGRAAKRGGRAVRRLRSPRSCTRSWRPSCSSSSRRRCTRRTARSDGPVWVSPSASTSWSPRSAAATPSPAGRLLLPVHGASTTPTPSTPRSSRPGPR